MVKLVLHRRTASESLEPDITDDLCIGVDLDMESHNVATLSASIGQCSANAVLRSLGGYIQPALPPILRPPSYPTCLACRRYAGGNSLLDHRSANLHAERGNAFDGIRRMTYDQGPSRGTAASGVGRLARRAGGLPGWRLAATGSPKRGERLRELFLKAFLLLWNLGMTLNRNCEYRSVKVEIGGRYQVSKRRYASAGLT
jgi:hypothetical protein